MDTRYLPAGYTLTPGFNHFRIQAPSRRMARYFVESAQPYLARSAAATGTPIHVIGDSKSDHYIIAPSAPNTVQLGFRRSKTPKQLDRKLRFPCIKTNQECK